MQKHHGPRVNPAQQLFKSRLMGGLAVNLPVHVGKAPEKGGVAQLIGNLKIVPAELSLGRPVVFRHGLPGDPFIQRFGLRKLGLKGFEGRDF